VGDQVAANAAAFRIDDLITMYVDLDVSEIDINQVQAGQAAELIFDAIPERVYHGQVTQAALTGEESSDVVNYTVTVQVDDADGAVRPGMTAQVDITTASRQGVLLVPNQAIQIEDGQTVVYVLRGDGQRVSVPVTLGLADEVNTEIVEGEVKVGDAVVLNPTDNTQGDDQLRMRMGPFGGGRPPSNGPRNNGGNQQP
jgi:HlyD family secretion protein